MRCGMSDHRCGRVRLEGSVWRQALQVLAFVLLSRPVLFHSRSDTHVVVGRERGTLTRITSPLEPRHIWVTGLAEDIRVRALTNLTNLYCATRTGHTRSCRTVPRVN